MSKTSVRCSECNSYVELFRQENRALALTCDCPVTRPIKVSGILPGVWME